MKWINQETKLFLPYLIASHRIVTVKWLKINVNVTLLQLTYEWVSDWCLHNFWLFSIEIKLKIIVNEKIVKKEII